ncbi:Zinc finger MYM-type protein 1 [Merluccius polli]|uniref:Zinc finger MYM-type protein 1 n=1 Tax=Merluccius polli TaxID=89951 RepID=A0AA47P0K7_MERPO|nr:Zinc finger MYM-type protein 1 [Merluccius polli]
MMLTCVITWPRLLLAHLVKSGKIQSDLISAVADVLNDTIKEQISKAKYFAIMVDESTDVSNAAQMSLILRYVSDEGVKERFLKFEDVTENKQAHNLAPAILNFLDSYECKSKVVAQSYDGPAVMASGINGNQSPWRGGGRGRAKSISRENRGCPHSLLTQITNRFKDHKRLLFVALLDPQLFTQYKQSFPENTQRSLDESYGAHFDLTRLRTELRVMYSMSDFQGKSPNDLLTFLRAKGLGDSMPQLHALTCLVVTIPVSPASVERSFSALKRIKTYSRNTTGQTRLSALASISIEKELLLQLKKENRLHKEVIDRFIRKERRMDFIFK